MAISSNDAKNYPDDSPEELVRIADEVGYPFPVLFDESQEVAARSTKRSSLLGSCCRRNEVRLA